MSDSPTAPQQRLNERQAVTLFLLGKGLRNAEIARQLGLSTRTVKSYVSQLFLIFDVTNRTELAGLFAPPPVACAGSRRHTSPGT